MTEQRVKVRGAKPAPAKAVSPRARVTGKTGTTTAVSAVAAPRSFWHLISGARPVQGPRLFAHTEAALRFFRMREQPVRQDALSAMIGRRAVANHVNLRNFKAGRATITLTAQGAKVFDLRVSDGRVDEALTRAFLAAMQRGVGSAEHDIREADLSKVELSGE